MHHRTLVNRKGDDLRVTMGRGGPLTRGRERVHVRDLCPGDVMASGLVVLKVRQADGRVHVEFFPTDKPDLSAEPVNWSTESLVTRMERP
jgi:hypothetical protein